MALKKEIIRTLALITQVGLSMLAPVLLCILLGIFLQKRFSVDLMLLLIILGLLAGCRNSWKLLTEMRRTNADKSEDKSGDGEA